MMKTKILVVIMTAFLMSGTMFAQHRHRGERKDVTPKERAERMTERMVKEYSLNDKQKQQLLEMNLQWMEQMKDGNRPHKAPKAKMKHKERKEACKDSTKCQMPGQQRADHKARIEKMMADRKAYDTQLQQILTKEQYAAYTKKMQERKDKMKERKEKMGRKDRSERR